MNLLLVEDDLNLGKALLKVLAVDYQVAWVRTLAGARGHHAAQPCDLLLLDLGLPDGDGVEWIESLREAGDATPVLVLSARDEVTDRVGALDLGADDYLVKPFDVAELKARVRVQIRRGAGSAGPILMRGDLSYATDTQEFSLAGDPLVVTPKEHRILTALVQAGTKPVSRERLTAQLGADIGSNALEVHVHSLRKQLGRERIETVRGFGYRLRDQ